MSGGRLPNLICPGAPKAGTTTLYRVLGMHPDVHVSRYKEIYYFGNDTNYNKGTDWYEKQFKGYSGQKYAADVTPFYLESEKAPGRIMETLGTEVKFIIMLRNPMERAFSQYLMQVREKRHPESFTKLLREMKSEKEKSIIRNGFYYRNISRYMEIFPSRNFHFILTEDLKTDMGKAASGLFSFLDIADIQIDNITADNQQFQPKRKVLFRMLKKIPRRHKVNLKNFLGISDGTNTTRRIVGEVDVEKPEMPMEASQILADIYEEDINKLSKLINRDLSKWLEK